MNTALLPALGLALIVVVGLAVLLLRRRGRAARPHTPATPPSVAMAPTAPPIAAPIAPPAPPPAARAPDPAAEIEARRQATAEALRLARQRKAEEAARLEAERAAQARADAAALRQPPRAVAPPAAAPVRPVASPPPPAAPALPFPRAVPASPPAAAAAPIAPAPVRAAARAPVVLVADDSKVVRVKTGRLLEKQGWQVLLAEDGAAALQLLDAHTPDLLITDVEMPALDGFALTRQVRAHARSGRLPVIMITSSDERHRPEADAAGVDLLLGKPYAEETLLAEARRLLRLAAPVLH